LLPVVKPIAYHYRVYVILVCSKQPKTTSSKSQLFSSDLYRVEYTFKDSYLILFQSIGNLI